MSTPERLTTGLLLLILSNVVHNETISIVFAVLAGVYIIWAVFGRERDSFYRRDDDE